MELAGDAVVTPNDRVTGKQTGIGRQVDVSIRKTVGQFELLIALDCKDYGRPLDVKEVEEFMGLAQDIGAHRAVMVAARGFSETAKKRAKAGARRRHRNLPRHRHRRSRVEVHYRDTSGNRVHGRYEVQPLVLRGGRRTVCATGCSHCGRFAPRRRGYWRGARCCAAGESAGRGQRLARGFRPHPPEDEPDAAAERHQHRREARLDTAPSRERRRLLPGFHRQSLAPRTGNSFQYDAPANQFVALALLVEAMPDSLGMLQFSVEVHDGGEIFAWALPNPPFGEGKDKGF